MSQRKQMKERGLIELHGVWINPKHKETIKLILRLSKDDLISDQTMDVIFNLLKK